MKTIGIFQAKTHLSELASSGEEILITNRGKKLAVMVPIDKYQHDRYANIFGQLQSLKKRCPLGSPQEVQQMKEEGRK
jgi:prevent-host-death family protein